MSTCQILFELTTTLKFELMHWALTDIMSFIGQSHFRDCTMVNLCLRFTPKLYRSSLSPHSMTHTLEELDKYIKTVVPNDLSRLEDHTEKLARYSSEGERGLFAEEETGARSTLRHLKSNLKTLNNAILGLSNRDKREAEKKMAPLRDKIEQVVCKFQVRNLYNNELHHHNYVVSMYRFQKSALHAQYTTFLLKLISSIFYHAGYIE